jgi:hypothetical protein
MDVCHLDARGSRDGPADHLWERKSSGNSRLRSHTGMHRDALSRMEAAWNGADLEIGDPRVRPPGGEAQGNGQRSGRCVHAAHRPASLMRASDRRLWEGSATPLRTPFWLRRNAPQRRRAGRSGYRILENVRKSGNARACRLLYAVRSVRPWCSGHGRPVRPSWGTRRAS